MDRLFFGFQVKLIASLLAAGLLSFFIVRPRVEQQISRNMTQSLSVPALILAESLAEEQARHPGSSAWLLRMQQRIPVPVAVLKRHDLALPAQSLAMLERGEVVVQMSRSPRTILYARVGSTDQVIRLGPLNSSQPWGQARGLLVLLIALGGLSLGVYLLVRPLRRRLAALSRAADALGRGELQTRAVVDSPDAIGNVAAAFNRMADEIERLIASQKELLRMVSHELRTPLARIHFALEKVRSAANGPQRHDGLQRVERDLRELDTLIDELLTYVRLGHDHAPKHVPTNIRDLVEQVIITQSELADPIALGLVAAPAALPQVLVNAQLLRRALGNLIENALRCAASRVEVRISQEALQLHLDVDDDGPGVPAADRERILEPFQRLDGAPRRGPSGWGLGLAIVRRIAEHHHGSITIDTAPLGGARFRMALPLVSTPAASG